MVRSVDDDFEALSSYLSTYTLDNLLKSNEGRLSARTGHKLYLSFLHLWAHCSLLASKKRFHVAAKQINSGDHEYAHFREAVADVGSGFFCCLHGAYKPAYMCLRSSIENFLRFIAGPFDSKALTTTSVHELFNIAKLTPAFSGNKMALIGRLQNTYKNLCKYTHSASLNHMSGVHALSHFPDLNADDFHTWTSYARQCTTAMTSALLLNSPDIYSSGHFKVKEVLDLIIPNVVRRVLLGGA